MQAGIKLTGSRVHVSRPKTAFKHVSTLIDVPSTASIYLKSVIEGFDDPPHDLGAELRIGGANQAAASQGPEITLWQDATFYVSKSGYARDGGDGMGDWMGGADCTQDNTLAGFCFASLEHAGQVMRNINAKAWTRQDYRPETRRIVEHTAPWGVLAP